MPRSRRHPKGLVRQIVSNRLAGVCEADPARTIADQCVRATEGRRHATAALTRPARALVRAGARRS